MVKSTIPGPQTLNLATSRVLFKNNSGIKTNIFSNVSEYLSQKRSSIDQNASEEYWKNRSKKGFYRPEFKVDPDIVNTIQSKMDKYIDSERNNTEKRSGNVINKRLCTKYSNPFLFHEKIPEVKDVLNNDILSIARSYFNRAHVMPFEVNLYRNFHIPPEDLTDGLIANHWHQDGDYTDILKIFVNISDVTKKDGPLHFISREDTIDLMPIYQHPEGIPDDTVKNNSSVVRVTGNPGTTVFVNTNQCLHRAGVPEEGHSRDILQIKLLPSADPIPEDWLEKATEFDLTEANRPPKTILG